MERIVITEPDTGWAAQFDKVAGTIQRILGGAALRVDHIGSTSVPGLAAKPVLDMMAGVANLAAARPAIVTLTELGWAYAPHRPEAYWFYRPSDAELLAHTHHLHLTQPGSALWRERLAFRDALRADSAVRDEYQALKRRLATENEDDLAGYTSHKRAFVARVLAGLGVDLPPRA
jgi:GrpB-like predicted nucleotidyltransferase (UPF0157 family)